MDDNELLNLIYSSKEAYNFEFKVSLDWNIKENKFIIVRALISLTNIRDGGYLVLGVREQKNTEIEFEGMKENDYISYNSDDVMNYCSNYADPNVEFDFRRVEDKVTDKKFVVFIVKEFSEIPLVCKKTGGEILKEGMIYVRTKRKNESCPIPSQTEMRELISLAVKKELNKLYKTFSDSGLLCTNKQQGIEINEDKFKNERGEF